MTRLKCIDCTLYFESDTEAERCGKCASRLGEGAVAPSPTSKMVSSGNSMWNGWSWYHGPGKAPHLLPVEVDLGIPSTVPEGGVFFFDLADGLDKPDLHGTYVSLDCRDRLVEDFKAMLRLQEYAIVQALMIPAHLIAPAFVAKPNHDGVADFKAHLLRWAADKSGLDEELKRRGLTRE